MQRSLLIGLYAISTVLAQGQRFLANFSTTSYNCGASVGCPIKSYPYYDSLYYQNISDSFQAETGSGNCYGVCAHSYEFYGTIKANQSGVSSMAISANYDKSKVASFLFSSFWAGCIAPELVNLNGQTFTGDRPATCEITIKGYTNSKGIFPPAGAVPSVTQTFKYTPDILYNPQGLPQAQMSQFKAAHDFQSVRIVTFSAKVNQSAKGKPGYQGPPSIYIDDLVYTVYNKTK